MARQVPAPRAPRALPRRLLFSFALICLLLAALGGFVSLNLRSVQRLDSEERFTALREIALLRNVADDGVFLQAEVLRHVAAKTPGAKKLAGQLIARIAENNSQRLGTYRTAAQNSGEMRTYEALLEARRQYRKQTERLLEQSRKGGESELLQPILTSQALAYNLYQKSLGKLIRVKEDLDRDLATQASYRIERTKLVSDILIGIAIVIAAGTGITIMHVVQRLRSDRESLAAEVEQHKHTDAALHESKERYRQLLEGIPDAIYVICDNKIAFANPAAEKLFGGNPARPIVGRNLADFVLPEDRAGIKARALEVARRTVPNPTERRLLRLDGTVVDVETNSMPALFEGRPAIQVITRDIAERKNAEEKLRAQEQQYRLLFEDNPSPMWVYDPSTLKFIAVNRAAIAHYGYSREEFLSRTLASIRPAEDVARLRREAKRDPEAPAYYAGIWKHQTKGGRLLTVEIHSSPITFDGVKARLTTAHDITERAENERKIRQSEASLALAQHVAGVGSWEYELQPNGIAGENLQWSAEVYHLFGRSPDTFKPCATSFFQAVHPEDRVAVARAFREFQASGIRLNIDHRIILPDQRQRNVHVAAEAIADRQSGRRKVIGIIMDVTKHVAAAAALRAAEEKYRAIFTNASEGIFQSTPEGRFLDVNPAAARIFGFATPGEMKAARSDITRQSYVDPQRRRDFVRLIEKHGVVTGFECEVFRRDGSKVWISENARAVRDAEGKTLYFEGTIQDISERKEAVRRLREQADLINLAHDAIMVRDMEDRVQLWNCGAERLYGWKAGEVLGRKISEFLNNLDPAGMRAAQEIFLELGEWNGEKRDRNKNGEEVIVHSRWSLVRDEFGQPKSKLVINTDITAQKRTEDQLLRTQRLESIGTLASGIAHDLNNVLLPIVMAAPILRNEPDPEERSKFLDIVEASAQRGASIVKQVVTFARGADGERVLLQPAYLVEEVAKIIKETFPKSITLSTKRANDLAMLEGDPTQLHQVLLNLCINARDAMPEGGLLTLEAENVELNKEHAGAIAEAKPGAHVLLTVTDSGQGIPPEVLPKIFDPFFTTKGVGEGTGLGLSTVAGIVRGHGGFIQVMSEPGQTRFKIFLPAKSNAETVASPSSEQDVPPGEGQTVLLVDDEPGVRKIAEAILVKHGYKVILASNGPEALAFMAHYHDQIDLVVTDLAMPIMNGLVLVRALRKIDSEIRIILSTGRANDFDAAEIARLQINDSLPKPYTEKNLLLKIANNLVPRQVAA